MPVERQPDRGSAPPAGSVDALASAAGRQLGPLAIGIRERTAEHRRAPRDAPGGAERNRLSRIGEFDDARVQRELALDCDCLGCCATCGKPVLLAETFMHLEGRVAHVDCRPGATRGDLHQAGQAGPDQPAALRVARVRIALPCVLRRRAGSPISARTIELGPEGMRVTAQRPLADDETVNFDLPDLKMRIAGLARVLRQQRPHVYALRFERLPESMYRRLHAIASRASHAKLR